MTPPIRRKFIFFLVLFNLIALPVLFCLSNQKLTSFANQERVVLPSYGPVAGFSLIERSGREISLQDLRGRVWLANFIFTSCAGQCPTLNLKMSGLQKKLPDQVQLVSFSVDPERDTPEVLSEYANRYHAEGERWLFLTGDKKTMNHVLTRFYVNNAEDPNLHSLRFALVDSSGQIRGYYNSEDDEAMEKLLEDARALLHEEK